MTRQRPDPATQRIERMLELMEAQQTSMRDTESRLSRSVMALETLVHRREAQLEAEREARLAAPTRTDGALDVLLREPPVFLDSLGVEPPAPEPLEPEPPAQLIGAPPPDAVQAAIQAFDAIMPDFDYLHVISHDLKEPLRGIAYFTQLLEQESGHRLDADGREHMDYILAATRRMARLLDDVLTLSRLRRRPQQLSQVNLHALVTELRKDLLEELHQRGGQLEVRGQLPTVTGDQERLRLLFTQLVRNALTFTEEPPRVQIWAEELEPGFYTLRIRDNGIGIEPEFQAAIFKLFYRLHAWESYEGTGAGLCLAQVIVRLHGGHIGVHSALGEGSIFSFTLPA